jgi:hypothetical protein
MVEVRDWVVGGGDHGIMNRHGGGVYWGYLQGITLYVYCCLGHKMIYHVMGYTLMIPGYHRLVPLPGVVVPRWRYDHLDTHQLSNLTQSVQKQLE